MNTITGKTSTGFEFNYDKRILLDWDYITLLSVMTSEESSSSAKLEATQKIFYVLFHERPPSVANTLCFVHWSIYGVSIFINKIAKETPSG